MKDVCLKENTEWIPIPNPTHVSAAEPDEKNYYDKEVQYQIDLWTTFLFKF